MLLADFAELFESHVDVRRLSRRNHHIELVDHVPLEVNAVAYRVADGIESHTVLHKASHLGNGLGTAVLCDKVRHRASKKRNLGNVGVLVCLDHFLERVNLVLADYATRNVDLRQCINHRLDGFSQLLEGINGVSVVGLAANHMVKPFRRTDAEIVNEFFYGV